MPWICPQCGLENEDKATVCKAQDFYKTPAGVTLKSNLSGKEMLVQINAVLGQAALGQLDDPGIKFVSNHQFRLEKQEGQWSIFPEPLAKNATFVNGNPVALGGHPLQDGDVLSIKDKHFHLTVSITG